MFEFIKKLFNPPAEPYQEFSIADFPAWLETEIAQSDFAGYAPEYLQQLAELKKELLNKARLLQEKELSEEYNKEVTPRVKTIVLGNKQHYLQAVEIFAEKINPPFNFQKKSITELKQVRQFNQNSIQKLNEFSHLSEKSYHAAKHLFYEEVDEIAKVLKTINELLLELEQKAQYLDSLENIEKSFAELKQELEKKEDLLQKIKEKQELLEKIKSEQEESQKKNNNLLESPEYHNLLRLKDEEKELTLQIKQLEYKVYSFVSKLSKPLRKFQYGADDKIIAAYLTDSVQAFEDDEELKIISILEALKESLELGRISFEEKLQKSYLEQIKFREELREFKAQRIELQKQKEKILSELSNNSISAELEQNQIQQKQVEQEISKEEAELPELGRKLEKINLELLQEKIAVLVKRLFKKNVKIGR